MFLQLGTEHLQIGMLAEEKLTVRRMRQAVQEFVTKWKQAGTLTKEREKESCHSAFSKQENFGETVLTSALASISEEVKKGKTNVSSSAVLSAVHGIGAVCVSNTTMRMQIWKEHDNCSNVLSVRK